MKKIISIDFDQIINGKARTINIVYTDGTREKMINPSNQVLSLIQKQVLKNSDKNVNI